MLKRVLSSETDSGRGEQWAQASGHSTGRGDDVEERLGEAELGITGVKVQAVVTEPPWQPPARPPGLLPFVGSRQPEGSF